MTTLKTATDNAAELANEARDSAEELGRVAARKLDEARAEAGGSLHSAASTVRTKGRHSAETIDNLATDTADRLDATASYIEEHDLSDALTGLKSFGRHHLAGSLLAAAAIGFLAGSLFGRKTA